MLIRQLERTPCRFIRLQWTECLDRDLAVAPADINFPQDDQIFEPRITEPLSHVALLLIFLVGFTFAFDRFDERFVRVVPACFSAPHIILLTHVHHVHDSISFG